MLKHAKLSQNYLIMIGLLLTGIYFQLRIFRSIICVHQKYFQLLPKTIALTIPYPFHSNIKRYTHFIISYFLYKSNELLFDYIDYKNKTFELMINEEMQETIR